MKTNTTGNKKSRRGRITEFELQGVILEVLTDFIGKRALNKMSSQQRQKIAFLANQCAIEIGNVISVEPS